MTESEQAHLPPIPEPPVEAADTPPSGMRRLEDTQPGKPVQLSDASGGGGTGFAQILIYVVALAITAVAALLYLQPSASDTVQPTETAIAAISTVAATNTPVPTDPPTVEPSPMPANQSLPSGDVPVDVIADLLLQAGDTAPPSDTLYRQQSAYTIAPVRPRSGPIQYTIKVGDTLESIAKQFGISTDSIVWNSDIVYVNRLFPGDTLTIVPEDGVLHKASGSETIQQIAEKYKVSAIRIIDSEYNPKLQSAGAMPETVLPTDTLVMVPGGVSEKKALYWNPPVKVESGGTSGAVGSVTFGIGQAGSCGPTPGTGGAGSLLLPLPAGSYNVTRGFSGSHGGIDLAGRAGTTVFAAATGNVMYVGWVTYGYGNVIVLNHGDIWTIYGHLSSYNVSCGQTVQAGQPIGATGSTGNSSGPHLHFEVRANVGGEFFPVNPTGYRAF